MTNKIPKTKQAITNLVDLDTSLFETLMINKVIPTANVKKYQNPIVIAHFLWIVFPFKLFNKFYHRQEELILVQEKYM